MPPIHALIVEDDSDWQDILRAGLSKLTTEIVIAADSAQAETFLKDSSFDLITVDLDLWGLPAARPAALSATIELLKRIRRTGPNRFAAMAIVTAYPEPENFNEILALQLAQAYLAKGKGLNSARFLASMREALLDARISRLEAEAEERIVLTLRAGDQEWFGCSLSGGQRADHSFLHPVAFSDAGLAEKSDRIGQNFSTEIDLLASNKTWQMGKLWRPVAKEVGEGIYRELNSHPTLAKYLSSASLPDSGPPLLLRFSSPVSSVRIPFELTHDFNDFLCLEHPIVRRASGRDLIRSPQALSTLLRWIKTADEAFRILVIAAQPSNAQHQLPSLSTEVEMVKELVLTELQDHLGVRVETIVLKGADASPRGVREAILQGAHFLHYAGHGLFDDKLGEKSGIVLEQDGLPKVLSAADLKSLVADSSLRFCFFNCCLSARSAASRDRGDFAGLFEALLVGSVPTMLGHRWEVLDRSSVEFARAFYTNLWRTFRFEDAVFAARKAVALGDLGRDDPCWASPILIDQSE